MSSASVAALSGSKGKGKLRLARQAVAAVRTVAELGGAAPDDLQREKLEAFPGWGPVAKLFDPDPTGAWAKLIDDLDESASDDMTGAGRVVDTSFFTPPELIASIYNLLRTAGFAGGTVLDLGCGSGRFLRHAPTDLPIRLTGVDVDPTSVKIARALHPGHTFILGELQKVSLPHKRFDVAVGNIPFSSANVHDGAMRYYGSLHEYFLRRAVAAVRPGGYVVVVTSRYSLDATHGLSDEIRQSADLLAAVRLPSGYFSGEGTNVVADVLVLRVRDEADREVGWDPGDQPTVTLDGTVSGRYSCTRVSRFWDEHPELVAGEMRLTGFDREPLAVAAADPAAEVSRAFAAVTPLLIGYTADECPVDDLSDVVLEDAQGRKEGSLHVVDGQVVRVVEGELEPVSRASAELRALIGLRDAAVALVEAEADWARPDTEVEQLRDTCRQVYSDYVERFGGLNRGVLAYGKPDSESGEPRIAWRVATLGGFRSDPDSPIVLALEEFDQDTGDTKPAPILMHRVNRRPVPATRADTAGEALAISLGEGRGLDLIRIANLLGLAGPDEAFSALGELAYRDPVDGRPIIARDYLSGNVRAKLREALAAAAADSSFERNVSALTEVQPPWLGRNEIRIELGSPWVTATDIADFCEDTFGYRARVQHVAPLAAWEVEGHRLSNEAKLAYCTTRLGAFELLQIGLNGAAPIVFDEYFDEVSRSNKRVRNADETEAAEQKLAKIAEQFSIWVWQDAARESRIVERYNNTMNAHVLRRHDGSHLTFPGLAEGIELWPHQKDFVDRAVSSPCAFAAHEVGLGKTKSAIAVAMTLRQFGLANRVACVVPNHLIEQITREAYQTWPSGRFLIVSRADLHRDARRRFAARVATGDWDLVIMTHETFSSIPVPARVERAWRDEQLAELENYGRVSGYSGKRIAAAVRSQQARIERLRDSVNDPNALTFPMLGLDYLIIDEADRFRRLQVNTRAEGFSLGQSKRAEDLRLKIAMLRQANPDRPFVTMMTGTPFTNTLAEGYVWQQFMAPEQLRETGLGHFDAWAAQFVRYEVIVETSPDGGGFRSKRRPSVIQNVPELRTMLSSFMSMVRAEDTGLKRPTPLRYTHISQPTEPTGQFMDTLVDRADDLRARRVGPEQDNMLLICGDGRKVALDPHLVGIGGGAPKLETVAVKVAEIYHETKSTIYHGSDNPGGFQLVLCDLGTPKKDDPQTYGRIRAGLIKQGIPSSMIRFVHEASTPKAREALFAACRDGRVAVLIGSTSKVGIGTNIQNRLHSLHHVDPTWTAAAWEQRNGRGIRNGNQHEEVGIHSYVVENTFDAYMFGTVERKSRGFEQLYRSDGQAREIEDIGEATLSFGELKAAAAGNDLLLRQHTLTTQIRKLRLAHVSVQQNVRALFNQAARADDRADASESRVLRLVSLAEHLPTMAGINLEDSANAVCGTGRGAVSLHYSRWTDRRVAIRFVDMDPGYRLDLSFDYQNVWSAKLPPKVRRSGAAAVREWAERTVADWINRIGDEIASTRGQAEQDRRQATDARATASAAEITEPDELVAARVELERVNQAIAEELRATDKAAAAA
ncbi:methyltransferase domain-containing protein [Mycobacterium sp. 134]|uniref:methyltransferase domain-containing protein n=1 Tax=Mycobacterium sp. 134 TaxID=3400425 RepID=UPI003AAF7C7C